MDVSILIISYNTREMTLACLRSVFEQTRDVTFEVIVLDNDSKDGSADAISAAFPGVRLLRPGKNLGFARGNNLAAVQARGEYVLLLNPDTEILDGAVQKVVAFAQENPRAGIVGGRTFFSEGTLNPESCHGRPTVWSLLCMGTGLSSVFRKSRLANPESLGSWARDSVRDVDAVSGCFMLIRREFWVELGGFDESFFMYGEDTDLCLRAWRRGAACSICPDARLIHHGGGSEPVRADKMVRLFRAKVQLFDRHWSRLFAVFGVSMLKCWAFSRMAALYLLRNVQPSRQVSYEAWRDVWKRRDEFACRQWSPGQPQPGRESDLQPGLPVCNISPGSGTKRVGD